MVCATLQASPTALTQFQSFIHIAALAASLRACGKAVYLDKVHTIPPAFVFKHREEHPERCVPGCLSQVVVTLHPLHVQILHAEGTHLAVVRECMGDLVEVVLAAVGDMFLQTSHTDASLVTVGRSFLFSTQPFL